MKQIPGIGAVSESECSQGQPPIVGMIGPISKIETKGATIEITLSFPDAELEPKERVFSVPGQDVATPPEWLKDGERIEVDMILNRIVHRPKLNP